MKTLVRVLVIPTAALLGTAASVVVLGWPQAGALSGFVGLKGLLGEWPQIPLLYALAVLIWAPCNSLASISIRFVGMSTYLITFGVMSVVTDSVVGTAFLGQIPNDWLLVGFAWSLGLAVLLTGASQKAMDLRIDRKWVEWLLYALTAVLIPVGKITMDPSVLAAGFAIADFAGGVLVLRIWEILGFNNEKQPSTLQDALIGIVAFAPAMMAAMNLLYGIEILAVVGLWAGIGSAITAVIGRLMISREPVNKLATSFILIAGMVVMVAVYQAF